VSVPGAGTVPGGDAAGDGRPRAAGVEVAVAAVVAVGRGAVAEAARTAVGVGLEVGVDVVVAGALGGDVAVGLTVGEALSSMLPTGEGTGGCGPPLGSSPNSASRTCPNGAKLM